MKDSYFNRFVEWQNYAHYLLLTIGLAIWNSLPISNSLIQTYMNTLLGFSKYIALGKVFLWFALGLLIIDSIIHAIFWFMPESVQWRD